MPCIPSDGAACASCPRGPCACIDCPLHCLVWGGWCCEATREPEDEAAAAAAACSMAADAGSWLITADAATWSVMTSEVVVAIERARLCSLLPPQPQPRSAAGKSSPPSFLSLRTQVVGVSISVDHTTEARGYDSRLPHIRPAAGCSLGRLAELAASSPPLACCSGSCHGAPHTRLQRSRRQTTDGNHTSDCRTQIIVAPSELPLPCSHHVGRSVDAGVATPHRAQAQKIFEFGLHVRECDCCRRMAIGAAEARVFTAPSHKSPS
jgi:hypothetical protein